MLKRRDLVSQFEELVQEEIKNHNDQLLITNMAINKLREDIEAYKKLQNDVTNFMVSIKSDLESCKLDFKPAICNVINKIDNHINDYNSFQSKLDKIYKEKELEREFYLSKVSDLNNLHNDCLSKIIKIGQSTDYLRQSIVNLEDRLKEYFSLEIKTLREEILNRPSEALQVKEEILKIFEIERVDWMGILKELRVYKREMLVQEKKIENLYTLIDRLEKKFPQESSR